MFLVLLERVPKKNDKTIYHKEIQKLFFFLSGFFQCFVLFGIQTAPHNKAFFHSIPSHSILVKEFIFLYDCFWWLVAPHYRVPKLVQRTNLHTRLHAHEKKKKKNISKPTAQSMNHETMS